MNDPWFARLRVEDRLAELVRDSEPLRDARMGAQPPPRLARRLAVALRSAADLLDAAPAERPRQIAEG
ncbi:MAG: hypothetical protein M3Z98_08875 [Candidatus Dormibacteraeota bacterium]|nr:hypothetical protein [Candidatus Dormibacteraeota bacterium]